jgi:hypothetical protein
LKLADDEENGPAHATLSMAKSSPKSADVRPTTF